MFEAIGYNKIPRSSKSISNNEQKGLTEPKIKNLIRKSRNIKSISKSFISQNNELDNIETRRIKSDQLVMENIARELTSKDRDLKAIENLNDEEAFINPERLIQQFLCILDVLDGIRKVCLEEQNKTEIVEEYSEKLNKFLEDINNLPFVEIDDEGKIDFTAAIVNLTKNEEDYQEYDPYFNPNPENYDPNNKETIIEDIDQIEDECETKEKNIEQIAEGEQALEFSNELCNIDDDFQQKSNQKKTNQNKVEDQEENGNPE